MANIKSAKKRILTSAKSTDRNKAFRTNLRTAIKKAEFALENNADDKEELVNDALTKLDRASGKGILHANNVARKKSQLQRKLNKASA